MQVQISITNPSPAVLAAIFGGEHAAASTETSDDTPVASEAPKKRGRKSNAEKAAEAAKAGASAGDDLGDDDLGDDDLGDDTPAKVRLEEDLIPAFKAFVKAKGGREPAVKILSKFNCKSVRELDESDYPAVMKLLKV